MKVCDVVLNSIWYDPRVRKQIDEYLACGIDVSAIGMKCSRYDAEKISEIPCKTNVVRIQSQYDGKQSNVIRKIKREVLRHKAVINAILAEEPDVIHANDLSALIPAYAAKRKLNCYIVYDSHEICVENYITKRNALLAFFMRKLEAYIVRRVDLMICVSNAAADYFANAYRINRPMVITNCSPAKAIIDPEYIQRSPGFEILNHGQFYKGRGYDIMVQACPMLKAYPEIKLAIRGFGRMEKQLRDTVEMLENKEQFIFYPPVTVQELIQFASKSHVGVAITEPICLNFKLSVSNKLFEYAAAGLPVIMSDIPEHRYLNEKYNFGIIISENSPVEFAKAVIELYNNPQLYEKLRNNAIKMSKEVNWESEFHRLVEEERNMLSKRMLEANYCEQKSS